MAHDRQQDIQWLDYAATDLSVAHTLFDVHRPQPFEIICYHCQQAAEKAIKSLFIFFDLPGGIPKKHDLSFLLNQMQHKTAISSELRKRADSLNVYGVISRYPNEISVDEGRTRLALQYADFILHWAQELTDTGAGLVC